METDDIRHTFLALLRGRYPSLRKIAGSRSLYEIPELSARIYIRYSKVHHSTKTFYGLRETDLRWLDGHPSVICFLWDGQQAPLILPYATFEDAFAATSPASDGQYKAQVYLTPESTEFYIAGSGRFNVDGYIGWNELNTFVTPVVSNVASALTHSQVQTLLGAIGSAKGNDVWFPAADRSSLDFSITAAFPVHDVLPAAYTTVHPILSEVDVVWLKRGGGEIVSLFEVEHTTTIYSGLLRFNDVHLTAPQLRPRFSIVANDNRRGLFSRQMNRPTFRVSGLAELCAFMQYENVLDWHQRIVEKS